MSVNEPLTVDCSTCTMQNTEACDDCLVTFLCDCAPGEAVIFSIDELRSARLLSEAGLVPELRHRRRPA
jgi:hypothetical protein